MEPRKYKETLKARQPLLVFCKLAACTYYEGASAANPENALCSHPHKRQHMTMERCPLYHMDWLRQVGSKR